MEKSNRNGAVIQLDDLTKTFDEYHAVNNVSLEVNKGEIFGFVGLNGAGKSTTIHMMLSLLKPPSGSVYLFGSKVDFGSYGLWGNVGFLEEASYYPDLPLKKTWTLPAVCRCFPTDNVSLVLYENLVWRQE